MKWKVWYHCRRVMVMGIIEKQAYCDKCDKDVRVTKKGINHLLHFLLLILTSGVWVFPWLLCIAYNSLSTYRCVGCEKEISPKKVK